MPIRKPGNTFMGYRRPSGAPGARNHLAIVSAMDNANPLARRIGKLVREAVVVNTTFGRNLFGEDERQHYRVMGRTAGHPNVGAAIVVSLEPKSAQDVADVAAEASPWMPVETLTVHETGGTLRTASRGVEIAQKLYQHLSAARRGRCDLSELTLGTECGGSDTTSGLVANPVTGVLADRIVDAGGVVLFSETMEIVGAEHLLAKRAASPKVRRKLLGAVARTMDYAHEMGMDIIGCNPTEDNIQGGLSSIEEKSLGAVKKAGTRDIVDVIVPGELTNERGCVFLDAPSAGVENVTALGACGSQAIVFNTGNGNPIGHPVSPTIKVTANPRTAARMAENTDLDISGVMRGELSRDEAVDLLHEELTAVLSGKRTRAEILEETEITVSRLALNL